MLKRFVLYFLLLICLSQVRAQAGTSLGVNCHFVSGILLTNQHITNFNVISKVSATGLPVNRLNILYNGHWYSNESIAVPGFMSIIQTGVILDRKLDICVTSISPSIAGTTPEEIIGAQLSNNF